MVHGDAVAHADGVDLQRRTAGHANARLHGVGDLLEVEVPWDNFVLRGDHGDERPLKLLVGKAICLSRLRCGARASPFFTASLLSSIHPRFPLRRRAAKRLVKFRKCEVMAWVRRLLRRFPRGRLDGCPSGLSPATQPCSMPVTGAPARHTDEPAARGIARRRHAFSCTARGGVPNQSPRFSRIPARCGTSGRYSPCHRIC